MRFCRETAISIVRLLANGDGNCGSDSRAHESRSCRIRCGGSLCNLDKFTDDLLDIRDIQRLGNVATRIRHPKRLRSPPTGLDGDRLLASHAVVIELSPAVIKLNTELRTAVCDKTQRREPARLIGVGKSPRSVLLNALSNTAVACDQQPGTDTERSRDASYANRSRCRCLLSTAPSAK